MQSVAVIFPLFLCSVMARGKMEIDVEGGTVNVNSGTAGLSHGETPRRSSPASASHGVSSRGNGLWSMDGGSRRLSGGGSGGAGSTRSASSSRAAASASPLGCEWSPRDTGDAFVRGCVLQGLSAQSCADGLQEELRRCHPEYQSWFAKVHDVNSREITRCECDFCHGNTIGHFHYDIASQTSMCRRSLSSIPSNLCSRPFREVWDTMSRLGACFVERVEPTVYAYWFPRRCGRARYCNLDGFYLYAFR